MSLKLKINFDNVKSLSASQAMIQERFAAMNNWRTPMKLISMVMYRGVMLNFRTQGARLPSGKWAPLSPVTLAARRKRGGGARALQNSGALMMNVNPAALADEATTTSNMPYTLAMQKGLPQRPGMVIAYFRKNGVHVKTHGTTLPKVPARPFMVLNDDDKKSIDLIALRVLQGRLGGSNGG